MTLGEILYQLLISPIELVLETVYGLAMNLFANSGFSIIIMSLVMNTLLMPLYKRADAIQDEERRTEKRLKPMVDHIKKAFTGDERYMMLQTYYRQNDYKPFYVLKGVLPLVLEIPFFIAAYHFLSNLGELQECSFGPVTDLGLPDSTLKIGSVMINILPVIMTLINVVSSSVYTKGYSFREKATLYGMAFVFFVLLYDSPSGLVLYWTMNNLFSLIKNVLSSVKLHDRALPAVFSGVGVLIMLFALLVYRDGGIKHRILVGMIGFMMELPLLYIVLSRKSERIHADEESNSGDVKSFMAGAVLLSVITGILIPSSVITSSPEEFVQLTDFYSPLRHVLNSSLSAFGLFVIWLGVFYLLAEGRVRRIADLGIWVLSGTAITNYMFFGTDLGMLSKNLVFENDQKLLSGDVFDLIPAYEKAVNLLVVLAVILILAFIGVRRKSIVRPACVLLTASLMLMSGLNVINIQRAMPGLRTAVAESAEKGRVHFSLSRNGRNVIVIMLDRAISSYVPYMFSERPELEKQFAGFTYYPNAVSFGTHTNIGSSAIFGGFEYTPEEMNKRTGESLVTKQNEAVKLMPVLFSEEGFDVTVCDPVYAGYKWIPDLTVFEDIPGINAYNTENGQFNIYPERTTRIQNTIWKRNFFCYGLMKIMPLALQANLYQSGTYFYRSEAGSQRVYDLSTADGIDYSFIESYSVLCSLNDITEITDDGDTFLTLTNQSTHQPMLLSEPDYTPIEKVDNSGYDEANKSRFVLDGKQLTVETKQQMMHYQVNMASLIKVGEWLDYLKDEGVYDNTRIIIVSDHGSGLHQLGGTELGADSADVVMAFNTFLMVKDFEDVSGFRTENVLMTTADVPVMAMSGVIADPVNPFTGKPIDCSYKDEEVLHLFRLRGNDWDVSINNGNTFLPGVWYSVHDDIFDMSNWEELGEW